MSFNVSRVISVFPECISRTTPRYRTKSLDFTALILRCLSVLSDVLKVKFDERSHSTFLCAGPSILDLLHIAALFPNGSSVEHTLIEFAEIGVVLLMFSAGMEVDLGSLARVGRTALAVRVRFIGRVSDLIFEGEILTGLRPDVRLQSPGYDAAAQRYDIEISGTASTVAITSNKETTLQALDGLV